MSNSARRAQGFDFGTSPHGLSVDLRRSYQKTRGTLSLLSLVDGFEVLGTGLVPVGLSSACSAEQGGEARSDASTSEAVRGKRLPYHYLELTDEQCSYVAFALICHIEELAQCKEAAHPEVLQAICGLHDALRKLEGRPL